MKCVQLPPTFVGVRDTEDLLLVTSELTPFEVVAMLAHPIPNLPPALERDTRPHLRLVVFATPTAQHASLRRHADEDRGKDYEF